ncbi:hypothetical protein FPL17_15340 [Acinetobacter dispersus]|nr:hypothetical protein FPL17_15340 [Acinetobacter dispersus]
MIKSLFCLSLRMLTDFVQGLINLCSLNWTTPDYMTICRRQKIKKLISSIRMELMIQNTVDR